MNLVYHRENSVVYHGDSKDMRAIADCSVHMVATSPPYWNAKDYSTWETYQGYLYDMAMVWSQCYDKLCDGGRIAVNVPMGYGRPGKNGGYICIESDTTRSLILAGFTMRGHIIWNKTGMGGSGTAWGSWLSASNPSLRDVHEVIIVAHKGSASRAKGVSTIKDDEFLEYTKSVWNIQPKSHSWHPAPFPDELAYRLIQLYTYQGDTVLDPFFGTGTTVWQAAKCGRIGIGVELSKEYIRRACGPMFLPGDF